MGNQASAAQSLQQGTAGASHQRPCPSCGHCPCCGRGRQNPYQWYPPHTYPVYPYTYWGSSAGTSAPSPKTGTYTINQAGAQISASAASAPNGATPIYFTT